MSSMGVSGARLKRRVAFSLLVRGCEGEMGLVPVMIPSGAMSAYEASPSSGVGITSGYEGVQDVGRLFDPDSGEIERDRP